MARLKDRYQNEIAGELFKKFGYKSVMQIPKLEKVVINVACGEARDNPKIVEAIVGDLGNGALANFPGGEDIEFKFDELSLAEKDLVKIVGREYVGLGLVGPDQFVRLTL